MDAWNVFDYSLVVFSCADLAAWRGRHFGQTELVSCSSLDGRLSKVVSMAKENGSGLRWAASMRNLHLADCWCMCQ